MLTRINLHGLFLCVSTSAVPSKKFYFPNYTFRLRYIRAFSKTKFVFCYLIAKTHAIYITAFRLQRGNKAKVTSYRVASDHKYI